MTNITNKKRRHKHRRRLLPKIVLLFAAFTAVCVFLFFMQKEAAKPEDTFSEEDTSLGVSSTNAYREIEVDGETYRYNTDLITILCLGVDSSEKDMMGQTDSISLVIFDRGEERIRIIGISRDSMVPIRVFDALGNDLGWDTNHLALAYPNGKTKEKGCLLAQEAVSKMFHGIPIIYYAAANRSAIPVFHDIVGEITIQIQEDDLEYLGEGFHKGDFLTLTSDNVEQFIRSRNTNQDYSNSGRMRRQQLYIEAYLAKLKTLLNEDFSGVVSRAEQVFSYALTNIGLKEITPFAEMALTYEFDPDQDYFIVQGNDQAGEYHDEFLVDEDALQQLVLQIFYRKK